jgi:hypothetical protein
MPIAPLKTPFLDGTGGLYLKIGNDIVRPPPAFHANSGMRYNHKSQAK